MLARADPWTSPVPPVIDELKAMARDRGPVEPVPPRRQLAGEPIGAELSNVEYAPLAEHMGRSLIASEVCNCNAPDTGNMEVLLHFGSDAAARALARPAARGHDPLGVLHDRARRRLLGCDQHAGHGELDGDEVVLNGRKWWSTGIGHPDCRVLIFMGLTDPRPTATTSTRWCSSRCPPPA